MQIQCTNKYITKGDQFLEQHCCYTTENSFSCALTTELDAKNKLDTCMTKLCC